MLKLLSHKQSVNTRWDMSNITEPTNNYHIACKYIYTNMLLYILE